MPAARPLPQPRFGHNLGTLRVLHRKEVPSDKDIRGPQDWTESDRQGKVKTKRWREACLTNLNAVDSSQYVKVVERQDFYEWFYGYTADRGYTTRWALAAYIVARGAHEIADMDDAHSVANVVLSLANVELQGAMREGNQVIFDNVLPKLKKLLDGGPLKGPAAVKWDMQVLAEEQTLIQPLYDAMSKESVKQLDYIARKKRFAGFGASLSGGDKVEKDAHQNAGTVPAFGEPDLTKIEDRWRYGMKLGDQFAPGGTGFDPARDKMPPAGTPYTGGSEFSKVATRHNLHQLDAWLNPNRVSRTGPGSDEQAIIAKLSNAEKMVVLSDRSADGWKYSFQFAQFLFIDEALVRQALPADPALKSAVDAFVARFKAERDNVNARLLQMRYMMPPPGF